MQAMPRPVRRLWPFLVMTLLAQTPPADEHTIRISVNLVEVDAVVTDRQGRPVKDLTKDDFEVLQDKKPQPIRSVQWIPWGAETGPVALVPVGGVGLPVPVVAGKPIERTAVRRTVALVIDDLGLSWESIARLRDELKKYIRERMQPTDLVAILTTGRSMGAMSQFTSDKRLLLAAVDNLRWNSQGRAGVSAQQQIGLTPEERMRRQMPPGMSGELNPDTDPEVIRQNMFLTGTLGAVQQIVLGLREYPGRKSLLLISENLPVTLRSQRGDATTDRTQSLSTGALNALQMLSDAANRSFVVIDTVDPRGLMAGGLSASDDVSGMSSQEVTQRQQNRDSDVFEAQNGLSYLAQATGGTFQFNNNDIGDMLRKAVDGVGGYYLITYRPDDDTFLPKAADKWHRVQVRLKRPDLRVRSRQGFLGRPDQELARGPAGPKTLAAAMMSPFAASEIHVRMTGFYVEDPKVGALVTALLHVDAKDLQFEKNAEGQYKTTIDVVSLTFGAEGRVENQNMRGFDLTAQNDEQLEKVRKSGLIYTVYHPVKKPGGFQLRIGLKERASGRMGTASQYVEIPNLKKSGLTLSSLLVQSMKADNRMLGGSAVRWFEPADEVLWGARILNAKRDKNSQPQLTRRVVVYRDGKALFQSPEQPWQEVKVDDVVRLPITGMLKFGAEMKPGEYVLQLVVTDKLESNAKRRVASQVVDFEVKAPEGAAPAKP